MLAGEGRAIIIISSELPEILGRADRILVIREGEMIGIIERKDAASDLIMTYATGKAQEETEVWL